MLLVLSGLGRSIGSMGSITPIGSQTDWSMLINIDHYQSIWINSGSIRINRTFRFVYWSILIHFLSYWSIIVGYWSIHPIIIIDWSLIIIIDSLLISRSGTLSPKTPFPEVYQSVNNNTNQYWSFKIDKINKDQ